MDISLINIPSSSHVDLEEWARITIENFQYKIAAANLISYKHHSASDEPTPQQLIDSFEQHITAEAGGNQALINIGFNYYLRMLDMGAGSGSGANNPAENRKKYNVYNKPLTAEIYKLAELLAKQYATAGATLIIDEIEK
jgi:hypothetical protein